MVVVKLFLIPELNILNCAGNLYFPRVRRSTPQIVGAKWKSRFLGVGMSGDFDPFPKF